jgi:acetolactate decarboxylase
VQGARLNHDLFFKWEKCVKKITHLYVSSPVNALVQGILREDKSLNSILSHGNFGLGTFNDLDGEMVLLDGVFYQLRSDGSASIASLEMQSPYVCATFFKPTQSFTLSKATSFSAIQDAIDQFVVSKNLIFAIQISGQFNFVQTRSVPKQDSYRPLVDIAHEQTEFTFTDVSGVMVGFWTPDFLHSVSVPGYHLHFLTQDHQHGGHLLHCEAKDITIEIQAIDQLSLDLPHSYEYLTADLSQDVKEALNQAEH